MCWPTRSPSSGTRLGVNTSRTSPPPLSRHRLSKASSAGKRTAVEERVSVTSSQFPGPAPTGKWTARARRTARRLSHTRSRHLPPRPAPTARPDPVDAALAGSSVLPGRVNTQSPFEVPRVISRLPPASATRAASRSEQTTTVLAARQSARRPQPAFSRPASPFRAARCPTTITPNRLPTMPASASRGPI